MKIVLRCRFAAALYLLGTQGIFPYTIDGFTGALSPIPGAVVGPGGSSIAVTPISWLAFLVP